MKQFAIIGLDEFGMRMLDELSLVDCEILVIDKDAEVIELVKDKVTAAYITDAINEESISRLVPAEIDAAIVDLGKSMEASILVCNYLRKMGVEKIIARAETNQQGEILYLVGASQVVYPSREAAKRIVPSLLSSQLFNYIPFDEGLVIAEVKMPAKFHGKNFIDVDFRRKVGLNVIATRKFAETNYSFFSPDMQIAVDDVYLVAGAEDTVASFAGADLPPIYKGSALHSSSVWRKK